METCSIDLYDTVLSQSQRMTAFKCLLYSKNANKNTMLDHYALLKNPTFEMNRFTIDLNRKYPFIKGYFKDFKDLTCWFGCTFRNHDLYCENDICKQLDVASHIQCRWEAEDVYFNSRYRTQIDCLISKYIEYANGYDNEVKYF